MIEALTIIAGDGDYPAIMAAGARQAGVKRITALAIRGAANRWRLKPLVDEWVPVGIGELERVRAWCAEHRGVALTFAGGVPPTSMFATRLDALSRSLLAQLNARHAHSIIGKICEVLSEAGVRVISAASFMDEALPLSGVLTQRAPDAREEQDIALGHRVAMQIAALEIGQSVVIKAGAVVAVEALEGTNTTIQRAGKLGGPGCVLVKVAKDGHDMRFDIPAFGLRTLKRLHQAGFSAVALQAGRTLFLEREAVLAQANRWGMAIRIVDSGLPPFQTRPE